MSNGDSHLAKQLGDIEAFKAGAKKLVKRIKLGVWYLTKDVNFNCDCLVGYKIDTLFSTRNSPYLLKCIAERVVYNAHKGYCLYEPQGSPYHIGVRLLAPLIDEYKEASEAEVTAFLL